MAESATAVASTITGVESCVWTYMPPGDLYLPRKPSVQRGLNQENNCVAVVPRAWILDGGMCLWPPGKNPKTIAKSVRNSEIPSDLDSWTKSECIVIHMFEYYESAKCKLDMADMATFTSDLGETADDVARKPIGKIINQRSNDFEHSNLTENANHSSTDHSNFTENDPAGSPTIVESDSDSVTYLFPKGNVTAISNFENEVIVALTDINFRLCKMENSLEYRNSITVYSVFEDKDFEDLLISDENDLQILSRKLHSEKEFRRKLVNVLAARFGAIGG
ncbi:unnamed protein product [Allacma fusca]|uniref:Uncharacterized protein n=1 Tax=Allacma fusca TaxID=39272 RepID=A0A8J2JIA9_9HEXA|nr:unnamed protein product [Allacma fusca]